jgi:hypothetical protein
MTLKTIAVGATLALLACLLLVSRGVFGQAGPAAKPAANPRFGSAAPAAANAAYQPAAGLYATPWVTYAIDGAHDEESAKLNAADAQMQQVSQTLLGQYSEADDDDARSQVKDKLAETLEKQFSVQQQLREREVAKIEARVKKLREVINKRNDARRSIIDKRLDQLIREAEGLGWNAPAAGGNPLGASYYQPAESVPQAR